MNISLRNLSILKHQYPIKNTWKLISWWNRKVGKSLFTSIICDHYQVLSSSTYVEKFRDCSFPKVTNHSFLIELRTYSNKLCSLYIEIFQNNNYHDYVRKMLKLILDYVKQHSSIIVLELLNKPTRVPSRMIKLLYSYQTTFQATPWKVRWR